MAESAFAEVGVCAGLAGASRDRFHGLRYLSEMEGPSQITRRTMVGGLAAATAASLLGPAAGVADALAGSRAVSGRWVGSLSGISPLLGAPRTFVLVGVEWAGPREARIHLRARASDGRWSPWTIASTLGHDADRTIEDGRSGPSFGEPIWTGSAVAVQLRTDRPAHGVRLHFVSLAPGFSSAATAGAASGLPEAQPVLDAGPGQPAIIARQAWAHGHARPRHAPAYGAVKLAFIHHTVNPNGYGAGEVPAMLTAIYDYHVHVRRFWDIGYNFVIDRFGRIWEARAGGIDMPVIGAQAGGYNAQSTGVAMLGDFMDVIPSSTALQALKQLLAWKLSLHGVPTHGHVTVVVDPADYFYTPFRPGAHVSLPRVAGHRQGDTTDCPGNALYARLPSLRPEITRLAGTPARVTLDAPRKAVTAGEPVALSGQLATLTGQPLSNAPLELQQLENAGARTVLNTTTDSDGVWSAVISLEHNAALRALHRPHPATVSAWSEIKTGPAITLELVSTSPLHVSGTISPSRPRVTVDVYPADRPQGKPVLHRQLAVTDGSFEGAIGVRGGGAFVLVARSRPDLTNAAGASEPLTVTLP
jgi:hypothetical protein